MDFGWSKDQFALHQRLRAFAEHELGENPVTQDQVQSFSRIGWERCAAHGVLALPIPEMYGGLGYDPVTCAFALEGLGYGCRDNGLLFSAGAHMWAVQLPIWKFGTPQQKERLLPQLCTGQLIGAHAITEPGAGSDTSALRTQAKRDGQGYVLNGSKCFITNGPIANLFLIYATINPKLGFTGITAFLVERDQPGLFVETHYEKMGLRTSPWAEVILQDCRIDASQCLGVEKQGNVIFTTTMAWERALILAPLLGSMQRQIDECIAYTQKRRQFGQRISNFQMVAHTIANMQTRLESVRLLTYKAASQLGCGETSIFSEIAKLQTSEAAVQTFLDAIEVHKFYGDTADEQIERDLCDALGTRISSGTSEMQRSVIAAKLGLR
jgi:alkylation response protein AidB-like acyl-CoA dehydrogenase